MQLSGLLEKLQSLFSPAFLISSLAPVFCCIIVNGAILAHFFQPVGGWIEGVFLFDTVPKTVLAVVSVIIVLVFAYVFSTFNLAMREALEGKYLKYLPKTVSDWFTSRQTERVQWLESCSEKIAQIRRNLRISSEQWKRQLQQARQAGAKTGRCRYGEEAPTRRQVENLKRLRSTNALIEDSELQAAVTALTNVFSKNSADLERGNWAHGDSQRLNDDHSALRDLIDYAIRRAEDAYIQSYNEREFNFSRYAIVGTRMGNIAESVRGYAQGRYAMNLDFFWTRFQKVLQSDSAFYKTVQDAKTQLDFAVSMWWLTVISTGFWIVLLPFIATGWLPLLAAATAGPLLAYIWYTVALQNYRSFGDLLRSSIDLFRFDLLKTLKISLPSDVEAERLIWDQLKRKLSYGEEVLIGYKHE
jgi:hypothetical protein